MNDPHFDVMSFEIPPPVRAAAGLAAKAIDGARRLPTRLLTLPVLAAGAAMQASLRLQQEYAGLVARGDELIVQLRGSDDAAPAWATFDDETTGAGPMAGEPAAVVEPFEPPPPIDPETSAFDLVVDPEPSSFDLVVDEPTSFDLVVEPEPSSFDVTLEVVAEDPPILTAPDPLGSGSEDVALVATDALLDAAATAPVPGYDSWTVAQLRARIRRLSEEQLTELLGYEQAGRQRAPYVRMLQNRLTVLSKG